MTMRYLVMECHDAYAVLMGEDAGCVRAANLHYTVGQTVTDPIIMQEDQPQKNIRMSRKIVMRCAAAAACLLIAGGVGFGYYLRNLKTHSTILMSSDKKIMIELNSRGNVVCIKSDQPEVQAMLDQYDARKKSRLDVIRELIELEKEQGLLNEGDTVDLYLSADDQGNYVNFKSEMEQENAAQDVTISVQPIEQYQEVATEPAAAEPPVPDAPAEPPAPKDPPHPGNDAHPAPPEPKDPPKDDHTKPGHDEPQPPHPHDHAEKPAPPAADEPPAPPAPEAGKPAPEQHEHPQPAEKDHAEQEHPKADEKEPGKDEDKGHPVKPAPPAPRPDKLPDAAGGAHPLP